MKSSKHILILVVLIVGALVAFFATRSDTAEAPTPTYFVTLEASTDKQSYQSGEEVTLTVNLTNSGDLATCISDTAQGNIAFSSITRDGQAVASRSVHAGELETLAEFVRADLSEVAPGERAQIVLTSSYDPGIEAHALYVGEVQGVSTETTFYSIQEPGSYEAQVAYEYPGEASDDCSALFVGQTNAATVTFIVE